MDLIHFFQSLLTKDNPVYVAISGGVDSVVLAAKANQWCQSAGIPLKAIHVNHGLSDNAQAWADFVSNFCNERDIDLTIRNLHLKPKPGESIEAVARSARYRALRELSEPGTQICTGHHADDQLETMLLGLKRGSGAIRMAGMAPVTLLDCGRRIVRPFLAVSRQVIEDEAERLGLAWVDDESNQDNSYDRNFLRNEVIPLLKERWPGILTSAKRSAATLRSEQTIIEIHAKQLLQSCMTEDGTLLIVQLDSLHPEERKLAIRYWIRANGFVPPREDQLEKIFREVAKAKADRHPKFCVNDWIIYRGRGVLRIMPN